MVLPAGCGVMGMPTPGDQPPRLTLLNAPLPSDEAIGRLFAATLQSSAEVLNNEVAVFFLDDAALDRQRLLLPLAEGAHPAVADSESHGPECTP